MKSEYYVPFADQRDLECRFRDHDEMLANQRAFRAAHNCEVCGAKKTHTHRHADGQIVVTCADCVRQKPTAERRAINSRLAEMRSHLAAAERSINK
jgi:hypothetical protein